MWLWLQSISPKIKSFLAQILILSIALHLIFLFSVFFVYRGDNLNLVIKSNLQSSNIPIVFMPFQKTVTGGLKNLNRMSKINSNKKEKVVIQNKVNTNLQSKSKKIEKKVVAKPDIVKKMEAKKDTKEKLIEKKKVVEEELIKSDIKPESCQNEKIQEAVLNEQVILGRKDMEILELQNYVRQEICNSWKPPAGLPKNLECIVKIAVDMQGKITQLNIEKSSKSLVYDLSIKRDIVKVSLPKEVWGQEILLTLNN